MKEKITTYTIVIFLFGIMFLNIITEDKTISISERRKLQQLPTLQKFTKEFEDYALDQFIFRDDFRTIKSYFNLYVLNKTDNNNLVYNDGIIYKLDPEIDYKSVNNFINIINEITQEYFENNNIYYSIIPDKSYFLEDNYLKYDYNELYKLLNTKIIPYYINIKNDLNINDYYKTDTHWNQKNLLKIVKKLSETMEFKYVDNYETYEYNKFYGVYHSQLGLKIEPEVLTYLTNKTIELSEVYNIESNDSKVYEATKLDTFEPYDLFLDGATPLITITNPNCEEKELIIFRDSFGSAIAPLLVSSYSKITLIDLRYISMEDVLKYIKIQDQDVLFLYSTLLVNNSYSLKK